ncbi:DUF1028 domain-containing protein [Arsenicicoccus sp. oral taxon 190]|uniref:DUF1028 domain-containing protein n=1 Tax=Arsenicicoccus sp. oral taxon 190 TaxID=1658671 RepID=UPI000679EE2B|nr:DUF1028 domain-containing protein [Arsenicicoccus sp. oral taxon 190]AKT52042.1 major pilin protein FimA [Arsenicicoccus sp. oral taxon 190]
MTFSIVANVGEAYGVAVASKFLAATGTVAMVRPGVGAVASQALANVGYRVAALDRLSEGHSAEEALQRITAEDHEAATRQVGIVGRDSQVTYTGDACFPWCGGVAGRDSTGGYAIQGNILAGEDVVLEMQRAWLEGSHLPFVDRLVEALAAGDRAGGDRRGHQSAGIYATAPGAGYDHNGVLADLRVDDHQHPVQELQRLVVLNELHFGRPTKVLPLEGPLLEDVRGRLERLGFAGDVSAALPAWAGLENLEMRLVPDGIDARVLQVLREQTIPPEQTSERFPTF